MADALFPYAPKQLATMVIYAIVLALVAFDFKRPLSRQNLLLLGLTLPVLPLIRIMQWERLERFTALEVAFTSLFLITALISGWALGAALGKGSDEWHLNLRRRGLQVTCGLLLAFNVFTTFARHPEDSGPYTSLGAQRWVETGHLPYGDPALTGPESPGGGSAATYGPALMAAHIPIQLLLGTEDNPPTVVPMDPHYVWPSDTVTQITTLLFHLVGLAAMFALLRRWTSVETALGALCLYMASPAVIGLGDHRWLINGLPFASHIAPSATMLAALWAVDRRPWLAGALLALACGVLYYPLFFLPAMLGFYLWNRGRRATGSFALGFGVVSLVLVVTVVLFTQSLDGHGPVKLFLESTLEHQEGTSSRQYGSSRFSFWGTHPGLASFFQEPLFGESSMFKPSFVMFSAFALAAFWLARGLDEPRLALLIAAVAAAIQLWKTHAGGTYVCWYLPFLLLGLFGRKRVERGEVS